MDQNIENIDQQILESYLEKHKKRIQNFRKQNPGKSLPIFKDPAGQPVWMNRKERRHKGII